MHIEPNVVILPLLGAHDEAQGNSIDLQLHHTVVDRAQLVCVHQHSRAALVPAFVEHPCSCFQSALVFHRGP